ncbi:MAG: hypothetical protein AABX77_00735 [Nanoarchaeota archaeon]
MALQFIDIKAGGIDFGNSIIKDHLKLKNIRNFSPKKRKKIINQYFDNYYKNNNSVLIKKLLLIREKWKEKENNFLKITQKIFNDFGFKKGMYIGYISIIDCNPRFLESKTFQVFYKKDINEAIYVIAHELLHFIFFDYFNDKIKINITEEKLWDLSEIFNVIILESDYFKEIINKKHIKPYPEHKKYLSNFRKLFKDSKNIKDFIVEGINLLN